MSPLPQTATVPRRDFVGVPNTNISAALGDVAVARVSAEARAAAHRDRVLVAQVADGDLAAMRALYEAHRTAVQRFAAVRLGDHFAVADIVHETMLSVWRNAERFEGRGSVRSWILSIARNKVIDHARKDARVSLCEPDESIPADDPDAEEIIAAAQDAQRVRAAVERLPDHQRAVVHLAFFQDLSYAEIAAVEGIPEGTVKTRIFHAKKSLMRCLSQSTRRASGNGSTSHLPHRRQ